MSVEQVEIPFYDKRMETASREEIEKIQLAGLRKQIDSALRTDFYRGKYRGLGISPDGIRSLDDIRKLPFTTKADLRDAYPFGLLAVPTDDVVRMHASSGTTGTPTVIYLTQRDLDVASDTMARCLRSAGCSRSDILQNMMTYGLFTGGLGLHYGAEKLGMMVIPASSGNTIRQIQFMRDFGTTVVHATPSYLLHLHAAMGDSGHPRSDFKLRKAIAGAEPHSEELRLKIERTLGIEVYNNYGMSEMNGPGPAIECVFRKGMHIWEDRYIAEIIDPRTLEPVPEGEQGELVLTILCREAMPLIRYRTRDLTRFIPGVCECGRTHRRIARLTGRTDDMLIINGVNVFPSQIEEVLLRTNGVGANYFIIVDKNGVLDRLTVQVEITSEMFADDSRLINALRDRLRNEMAALITINPIVEIKQPGTLPVSEGKAKRVDDRRPKD